MAADAGAGCVARGFGGTVLVIAARVTPWPCGRGNGLDDETQATLRRDLAHIKIKDLSI